MGRVRRNWTLEEDNLLRRAVQQAIGQSRPLLWRDLAKAVPGRSNKDCRRRWWNTLAEGVTRGPWSEQEDAKLIAAVQQHGTNWSQISRLVETRNSDQCASHWSQVLNPDINFCDWVQKEDENLLHEVLTHGTNWAVIAGSHTPKRTTLALKNRYSTLRLRHDNSNSKAPAQATEVASGISKGLSQEMFDDGEDAGAGMESDESDNENSVDYHTMEDVTNSNFGELTSPGHMIAYKVVRGSISSSIGQLGVADNPELGKPTNNPNNLFRLPATDLPMENWMTDVMSATQHTSLDAWQSHDLEFSPEDEGAEFLLGGHNQTLMGLPTPPSTSLEKCPIGSTEYTDFSKEARDSQQCAQPTGKPIQCDVPESHLSTGGSFHVSIGITCTKEQLSDIMSFVVSTGKCISLEIKPDLHSSIAAEKS